MRLEQSWGPWNLSEVAKLLEIPSGCFLVVCKDTSISEPDPENQFLEIRPTVNGGEGGGKGREEPPHNG